MRRPGRQVCSRPGLRMLAAAVLLLGLPPAWAQENPPASTPPLGPPSAGAPAPSGAADGGGPVQSPPPAPVNGSDGAPLRVVPPAVAAEGVAAALGRAVLTVDQEAMYRQSRWGMRAQAEIAAQSRQVAADNDRAFAALVADEDALTAARATLPPEEFRARAAQFDEQAMAVRDEREAARNALNETAERDRALFLRAAAPVLGRLMTSRGALVVLDQRTVLIADERIDVTAATIAALDAELGDGREFIAAALAQARAREEAERSGGTGREGAPRPDGGDGAAATEPGPPGLDQPSPSPADPQASGAAPDVR